MEVVMGYMEVRSLRLPKAYQVDNSKVKRFRREPIVYS